MKLLNKILYELPHIEDEHLSFPEDEKTFNEKRVDKLSLNIWCKFIELIFLEICLYVFTCHGVK